MVNHPPARFSLDRFIVGEGPEQGTITLRQRRVYILPSRAGLIFALMLLPMLLAAINYNNSLAYALTFLLASLAVVSILYTYRNLHGLSFKAGQCQPVFVDDEMSFPVCIHNPDNGIRLAIKVAWPHQAPQSVDLAPGEFKWLALKSTAARRGLNPMGRFTVYTRYPLGLFHAWSHLQFDMTCLVYPKPDIHRELPHEAASYVGAEGDRGRGTNDFTGFRPYHAGDSLRLVNWKALARERGLLTKQFGGDRANELMLSWDILAGLDTEARLSRLARWVLEAELAGLRYGLVLPDQVITPLQGEVHRHACLKALAMFGKQP